MSKIAPSISDLFDVPARFLRSVQLERDFSDPTALDNYVVTPHVADAFSRIVDGLRATSGRRAWRITGDYGSGKSSFALVLANALAATSMPPSLRIGTNPPPTIKRPAKVPALWPILLTGSREPFLPALARGIGDALRQRFSMDRRRRSLAALADEANSARRSGDLAQIMQLIEDVREQAAAAGAGLLLIIDELGKFLEYAAQRPDREDVFILQRLAEQAARSADRPFVVLGLLHQGFQAYADRLPSSAKHEWEKVAGRFDEIVFDQPLAHAAALIAGSLNMHTARLSSPIRTAAQAAAAATAATGWLNAVSGPDELDAARLYPLHPTILPVLIRFFARFGQNERSLFGFLLSSEPFGLQAFSSRPASPDAWYGLAEFYDYVRAAFGHRLSGASYRNQWLRILATIDAAADLRPLDLRVLKAIAVLNLLDADDLLPTDIVLRAAFAPTNAADIATAIGELKTRGLLFQRGSAYRLWPNGSVSLDAALEAAARAVGPVETVAAGLDQYLDHDPILARRHYVESGTLRYFELRYAQASALQDALQEPTEADGIVVIALADTEDQRETAIKVVMTSPFTDRPKVIVGVVQPLLGLAPELQDLRCWQWVSHHTPELRDDLYVAAEAGRQLALAKRALAGRLKDFVGLRSATATGVQWFLCGKETIPRRAGLSGLLSDVCDRMYSAAPLIANELLNRNSLSSAAAAARMRLIEGIFTASDRPLLGLDATKSPPEKSMYLSVLQKGAVHIQRGDRFAIVEPGDVDPLRLRPALTALVETIETARGDRVSALELFDKLRQRPFGVRAGVAPLLLAIVLSTRSHELAVYEQGTFLHRFGPSDFLRLTKTPANFEIQHCRVAGVRLEVFNELAAAFAQVSTSRRPELLEVVRPLCQFAAQLPEYTRRTTSLSPEAAAVRDTLLSAREPATMLFRDLPEACGVGAFSPDQTGQTGSDERVKRFVSSLHDAIGELRAAYPALLNRIIARVSEALGENRASFDRARLAARAARVSLAAREPRLRTFSLRLRDPGLSDESWAEALASFIIAKPPAKWISADDARFGEEVGALSELFHKVEATAFHDNSTSPAIEAIRLNLTRGDGEDIVRIVKPSTDDGDLTHEVAALRGRLPQDRSLRLQLLAQLLWTEMKAPPETSSFDTTSGDLTAIRQKN